MMSAVKKYQKGNFFLVFFSSCKKKTFCVYLNVVNLNVCFYKYAISDF